MNGCAAALMGLVFLTYPVVIESDVYPIEHRDFHIPFQIDKAAKADLGFVRLLVSVDGGRTWNQVADARAADDRFRFHARTDGHYWFAVQVVKINGRINPRAERDLKASLKVYVNSQKRDITVVPAPGVDPTIK